jgi:hypothetical protein
VNVNVKIFAPTFSYQLLVVFLIEVVIAVTENAVVRTLLCVYLVVQISSDRQEVYDLKGAHGAGVRGWYLASLGRRHVRSETATLPPGEVVGIHALINRGVYALDSEMML